MTAAERHQILVEWNRTERDYPRDKCVHQLFEEQVERTPDAVAVVFEKDSLTYRELNARANQLAHHLRSLGVGPDVLVGLCVERSLEMMVGLLGILKAGGAYVPLEPGYPKDRLAFMLADANASVILTQGRFRERLPPTPAKVICLDSDWEIIERESQDALEAIVTAENLAYVIYTSGSTGRPKGAMNIHRGICNRVLWMQEAYPLTETDRVMQKTPFSFDVSVWEFFWPLLAGARLVIAQPDGHRDSQYLIRLIISQQITIMHFVPAMMRHFLQDAEVKACSPLRRVFCSGEALTWDLQAAFCDRMPGVTLHNLYGPTEAAVDVTHWTCKPNSGLCVVPIGRPIANTQIYILDEELQPVPVGVAGELHIGGVGVGRGYLNRPELTIEKFIPNPFNGQPGARLYKTGDLARWLPDGDIEYLGRSDHQAKIRGHRIELGEVEAVLSSHPAVASCAVLAQDHGGGDKVLAAFVVGRDQAELSLKSLRQWLGGKLPDYMIPSRFVAVPALPLTPNGKVDRKALEEMDGETVATGTDYVAPRNEQEQELAEIWQAVLRRERVGVQDNFFELGGHSLLAVVICSQIQRRLGREAPLRWVFDHPTIEGIATQLETQGVRRRLEQAAFAIERVPRDSSLPLSPGQVQLWFLDQLEPESAFYILPRLLRVKGPLSIPALKRSLTELARRHESLRTVFPMEDNQPRLRILPATEIPLELIALEAAGPARETEGLRQAEHFLRRPFDLARGPVFRAGLVGLGPDDHILALAVHHIASDGWSLEVMQRDLAQCYGCVLQGQEPDWTPLPVQFADYVCWQQKQLQNGELVRQLDFWKQHLAGIPPRLELPTDWPRRARQTQPGAVQTVVLEQVLTQDLKRLAHRHQATLFLVMLSAFEVLLQRLSGQEDFVVGTPVAGRRLVEMAGVTGFFMSSLPLRADLAGEPTFLGVLERCRETFLRAAENQDVPFQQVVAELQPERDLSQTPVFQVLINHLSYRRTPGVFAGLKVERIMPTVAESKFDLTLYFEEVEGWLELEFVYARTLFSAERMAEMARQFEFLLQQIVIAPERQVQSYSLVTPAARARLPDPALPLPTHWAGSLVDRFRERAARHPERVAIEGEGEPWTYGDLELSSNQLAESLISGGLPRGSVVIIYARRRAALVSALLGVWQAGGAFCILDARYPAQALLQRWRTLQPQAWISMEDAALLPPELREFLDRSMPQVDPSRQRIPPRPFHLRWKKESEDRPSIDAARQGEGHPRSTGPDDLAYVAFTSGSTGLPNGVVGTHQPLAHFVSWHTQAFDLTERDRFSVLSGLAHDPLLRDVFTPLAVGATLCLPPEDQVENGSVADWMARSGITVAHVTPVLVQLMTASAATELPALRRIFVVGDVLKGGLVRDLKTQAPNARLVNFYGATETPQAMAFHVVAEAGTPSSAPEAGAEDPAEAIPIGQGIDGVQLLVLNRAGKLAGVGEMGEIGVRTGYLAQGYWRDEALTREKFIANPATALEADRLYRTGDLGRYLPNGEVVFVGRQDNQVKIRGFRVELGEIEAVLGGHPAIESCAVVAQGHGPSDKVLLAFIVSRDQEALSVKALRPWLEAKLPAYMIPARFITIPALPVTPNGKLDQRALLALEAAPRQTTSEESGPINLLELELIRIWRRLFQHEAIGRQDNFFALGGHSLLAVRLAMEIEALLGCKLAVATLFQSPTIELLAQRLTDENWAPPWSALVPLQPNGSQPALFFVHGWGGNVYMYWELARLLPAEQPSYGIQAAGLDGKSARHITVEAMAAHYVNELVSFQPEGAFYLAGYSLGGKIAYEIARQLQHRGRRVALLALIDTYPSGQVPWFLYGWTMVSRGRFHFRRLWQIPCHEKLDYLKGRWKALMYWINSNRAKPAPLTTVPKPSGENPKVTGFSDYYQAVASAYQFRPYPGPADALFVDEKAVNQWRWYWRYLVRGGVTFHPVAGDHMQVMFSPEHRSKLAHTLTAVLHQRQAQEQARQANR